ncbi:hypothetical protein ACFL35_18675 [Candidatus Riflebacteria bacterium]
MQRSVFHLRFRTFAIQAERLLDSSLKEKSIAVVSGAGAGGSIISLSEEAYEEGLSTGLRLSLARKISPRTVFLPYNTSLYASMNQDIFQALNSYSPLIEPGNFGQFFLDMSGMDRLYPRDTELAIRMLKELARLILLKSCIAISSNKLVSRLATRVSPESIYKVDEGSEPDFLAPLSCKLLPAVKFSGIKRIIDYLFIKKIKPIQQLTEQKEIFAAIFGSLAARLKRESHGLDDTKVEPASIKPQLTLQKVLPVMTNDKRLILTHLDQLSMSLARRLRQMRRISNALAVEIHYSDGFKRRRQGKLLWHDNDLAIKRCRELFFKANDRRQRMRSIILSAGSLQPAYRQLSLFEPPPISTKSLHTTLDNICSSFGSGSVKLASFLGK